MYRNEREVGSAILAFLSSPSNTSSLKREDIHFTSKLASNTSYEAARKSIKQSVEQSGLGHIDLFLLHSPYGGKVKRLECWRAVEDAIEDGEVRTGGVSNFGVKHVSVTNCNVPFISSSKPPKLNNGTRGTSSKSLEHGRVGSNSCLLYFFMSTLMQRKRVIKHCFPIKNLLHSRFVPMGDTS